MIHYSFLRSYFTTLLLISSIILGGIVGYYFDGVTPYLKPLGDIFIRLILTTIVPFVFFNIAAAIARTKQLGKMSQVFTSMITVFVISGLIAALIAMTVIYCVPIAQAMDIVLKDTTMASTQNISLHLTNLLTVKDFTQLFSHQHILALIIFSSLVGLAATSINTQHMSAVMTFLESGETLFTRIFSMVMYFAPIGFFAYFAVLMHELGASMVHYYARITTIYYLFGSLYFVIIYSIYAYIAGHGIGFRTFWQHISIPAMTSIATCSSAASMPANLIATKAMQVPSYIADTTIPIGSMLHKEGSIIGGVFKIAFLFYFFHIKLTGLAVWLTAIGISTLVGLVMGAIPGGGLLGELFILAVYGFPSSALLMIAAISVLIDPLATLLNVTGNSVSSMLIARLVEGKKWLHPPT